MSEQPQPLRFATSTHALFALKAATHAQGKRYVLCHEAPPGVVMTYAGGNEWISAAPVSGLRLTLWQAISRLIMTMNDPESQGWDRPPCWSTLSIIELEPDDAALSRPSP